MRASRQQGPPGSYDFIANGKVGVIPFILILTLIVICIYYLLINRSIYGRYFYAVGANPETAFLTGINIRYMRGLAYVISSVTASLTGVIFASRIGFLQPRLGDGFSLDTIAVGFLSATMFIKRPNVAGVIIGSIIIITINNMLTLANASEYLQEIMKGIILIIAVAVSSTNQRYKN